MLKTAARLIVAALTLFFISCPGLGESAETVLDGLDLAGLEEIADEEGLDLRGMILRLASGEYRGEWAVWKQAILDAVTREAREAGRLAVLCTAPGLLAGCLIGVTGGKSGGMKLLCAAASAFPGIACLIGLLESVAEMTRIASRVTDYALPAAETLLAFMGASGSVAMLTPLSALVGSLLSDGFGGIGVSLAKCAAALAVAGNLGSVPLDGVYRFLKKGTEWAVGIALTVFLGILSAGGSMAVELDRTSINAAKYTIDSVLPVVGGEMKDTLEPVLANLLAVKAACGVASMLLLARAALRPLIRAGMALVALRAACAIGEPVAPPSITRMTGQLAGAAEMLTVLTAASAVLVMMVLGSLVAAGSAAVG